MAIKRLGNARWLADIQPGGRSGRRYRATFETKAEALSWCRKIYLESVEREPWMRAQQTSITRRVPTLEPKAGIVYIMRCDAHAPNVFKVGCTTRSAHARAAELSRSTSAPVDFTVVAEWRVSSALRAEKHVFETIRAYRLNGSREFFVGDLSVLTQLVGSAVQE